MSPLDLLGRIANVEFAAMVTQVNRLGSKLRVHLVDKSYIDVYVSRKLPDRFGFHWERGHIDGSVYRYDSFPGVNWSAVSTFPFHFHAGTQETVVAAPFPTDLEQGFRGFPLFVQERLTRTI